MKTSIQTLRMIGAIAIIFSAGYFMLLYKDFTQLILALGIAGILVLMVLSYIYNWMKEKDEELQKLKDKIEVTGEYAQEFEHWRDKNDN